MTKLQNAGFTTKIVPISYDIGEFPSAVSVATIYSDHHDSPGGMEGYANGAMGDCAVSAFAEFDINDQSSFDKLRSYILATAEIEGEPIFLEYSDEKIIVKSKP